MKKLILIISLLFFSLGSFAQTDTDKTVLSDTSSQVKSVLLEPHVKRKRIAVDSVKKREILRDTIQADSLARKDSPKIVTANAGNVVLQQKTNSIARQIVVVKKPFDNFYRKLLDNPFLRTKAKPIYLVINDHDRSSKDEMFYLVVGLLAFLAFIKLVFSKYFQNMFRLFFQPSFRQKQTREQLQQGNFPGLLLNLFFILSVSAYISFVLSYYHLAYSGFWFLFLYSSLSLITLYVGKYVFLSFAGWVFNVKEITDTYIFAIYLINKILGVVLIPFTIVIAFSQFIVINTSITVSLLLIVLLFLYRYIISYGALSRDVKITPLHFLFYVIAFEIIPLLLIYKTLMLYLNKSL